MSLLAAPGGLTMEEDMKRVMPALVLLPLFSLSARAEDPVYFADPTFKAAVEARLWIADPTPTDMLALTELVCIDDGITDLAGIEYALNLQKLWLRLNPLGDISLLSGLTNLRTLHLSISQISDISPLSGLSRLEYLDLHGNQIVDISPLAGLANLEHLILHRNLISDITPLSGLSSLQYLDIQRNQISDLSPLAGLSGLHTLILEYNEISDVSALSELTLLEYLDLRENPLNEEAYNIHIPKISDNNPGVWIRYDPGIGHWLQTSSTAGGTIAHPGEGKFFYDDGEVVLLEAIAKPGFVFAHWSGSNWTTENPTSITVSQDSYVRAVFRSTLDVMYVDGAAEDSEEDGTPEHPFDSIQEAIEVAADDVSIVVRPGTYRETVDFLGKCIRLLGADPNDPERSSLPVIDGAGAGPVISFARGEDSNCVLTRFVITGGHGNSAGAIYCRGSSPLIANCLIVGNRAAFSNTGAILCVDSQASFVNCWRGDGPARATSMPTRSSFDEAPGPMPQILTHCLGRRTRTQPGAAETIICDQRPAGGTTKPRPGRATRPPVRASTRATRQARSATSHCPAGVLSIWEPMGGPPKPASPSWTSEVTAIVGKGRRHDKSATRFNTVCAPVQCGRS